jgi:hypothetical protein
MSKEVTYAHHLLQRLQCSAGTLARLSQCLQQGGDDLVNSFSTQALLQDIESLCGSSADVRFVIHERSSDHSDDTVFMAFLLGVGRV